MHRSTDEYIIRGGIKRQQLAPNQTTLNPVFLRITGDLLQIYRVVQKLLLMSVLSVLFY